MEQKLKTVGFFQPNQRLPFKAMLAWVQLKMYEGELQEAEQLMNTYIQSSTHLADPPKTKSLAQQAAKQSKDDDSQSSSDEAFTVTKPESTKPQFTFPAAVQSAPDRPFLNRQATGQNLFEQDNQLPLASAEYYTLCELIVFQIELPTRGMKEAQAKLQKLPLPARIRVKFQTRLQQLRNMVVADVQLSKGEPLSFQQPLEDRKDKQSKQEESKVDSSLEQQQPMHQVNPFVEALVPTFVRKIVSRLAGFRKRVRTILIAAALICLVYTMYRKGILSALVKTRLVQAVVKLLFNYDIPAQRQ